MNGKGKSKVDDKGEKIWEHDVALSCHARDRSLFLGLFQAQPIKHQLNPSTRLIDIKGHIPAISIDPFGSHFIRKKLGSSTNGEVTMVYKEIMPHAQTLARDVFANHVVQKLLDHGPLIYRSKLIKNLIGHVLGLSFHPYGNRVIQKAFEISSIHLQIKMAKELGSNVLNCVFDQHANHVIVKCIECVQPQYIQFIYKSLCGKAKMLSSHPYGCRLVQKVLEFCNDLAFLQAFVGEIFECANQLSEDQFGNYVVQCIVQHGGPNSRQTIVRRLAGRIVDMSHDKFSSNVIQKCLIYGSYQDRRRIIAEILCAGGGQTAHHLLGMMVHPYANYVVQQMLEVADGWEFSVIMDVVRHYARTLDTCTQGRHVIRQAVKLVNARAGLPLIGCSFTLQPPLFT